MLKNILLIGKTGSGKSTLANVLTNTNEFKEGSGSISETREVQSKIFKENDIDYQIIDTVGIGDTSLPQNEVLDKIAEAVYLARAGIHQIFFLLDGRFDPFEASIYKILSTIIFDEKSTDHTTIIRTRSDGISTEEDSIRDIESIKDTNKELAKIIEDCKERFIHVNNPPLSSENSTNPERERKIGELRRGQSRKKIVIFLSNLSNKENYIPEKLKNLSDEIKDFMEDNLAKKKEFLNNQKVKEFEQKRKSVEILNDNREFNNQINLQDFNLNLNNDLNQVNRISSFKSLFEKENYSLNNKELILKNEKLIKETIKDLKDWKEVKKLKEDIIKLDEKIRKIIRSHILDNKDEISKITGGNQFVDLIENDQTNSDKRGIIELIKNKEDCEEKLRSNKKSTLALILSHIEIEINNLEDELLELRKIQLENNKELLKQWINLNFRFNQIIQWAETFKENFNPEDYLFYQWLSDKKRDNFKPEEFLSLKEEYEDYLLNIKVKSKNINAQEWLNEKYPHSQREQITELDLSDWNERRWEDKIKWKILTGKLNLSDFTNLKTLNCSDNKLTSLDLSNCLKLEKIDCNDNQLTEIKFSKLQKIKTLNAWNNNLTELEWSDLNNGSLTIISLSNNNFQTTDISIFRDFTNLVELYLGNDIQSKIDYGIYNRFHGSLKSLRNLTKLEVLQIEGTEIAGETEYLTSLKRIVSWDERNREKIINSLSLNKEEANKIRNSDKDNISKSLSNIIIDRAEKSGAILTNENKEIIREKADAIKIQSRGFEFEKEVDSLQKLMSAIVIEILKERSFSDKFTDREQEINYLETRIQELINLIKQRREKIVDVFTRLLPDKKEEINLIQELVITHLEFIKVKKQSLPSVSLRKKRDKIRDQLEDLLGDELEEEIEKSLTDCEELVTWEFELDERLTKKALYIKQQKQSIKQLTYNQENEQKIINNHELIHIQQKLQRRNTVDQMKLEIAEIRGKSPLEVAEIRDQMLVLSSNHSQQFNISTIEVKENFNFASQITKTNSILAVNLPDNIYNFSLNFLKAKDYFYLARKQTINNLQAQIQSLESKIKKIDKGVKASELIINVGNSLKIIDHGITGIVGSSLKAGTNLLSSTYTSQQGKQVHLIFQNSEEEDSNLQKLNYAYSQLNQSLNGNNDYDLFGILDSRYHSAFKVDYHLYQILEKQVNIWHDRSLNRERLEKIYQSLQVNLSELCEEIDLEFLKLKSEDQVNIRRVNEERIAIKNLEERLMIYSIEQREES